MADYKETNIAGKKWQRAHRVTIDNTYQATPSVIFDEEEIINIEGGFISKPISNLSISFNPQNQLHVDIYTKLNELYILLREARDAQ